MRILLALALVLAAAPAEAASFFSADRSVRAHIDDGAIPGATEEMSFLDQGGDFVETREVTVEHDGAGAYSNHARADQQSNIGGASVSFLGSVDASGTSESGGPDSSAETRLEVDIVLDQSEAFSLTGAFEIELGNGEVALEVSLSGAGVTHHPACGLRIAIAIPSGSASADASTPTSASKWSKPSSRARIDASAPVFGRNASSTMPSG